MATRADIASQWSSWLTTAHIGRLNKQIGGVYRHNMISELRTTPGVPVTLAQILAIIPSLSAHDLEVLREKIQTDL